MIGLAFAVLWKNRKRIYADTSAVRYGGLQAGLRTLRYEEKVDKVFTPPPVGGGVLFSGDLFLSFFVSLSATLRENGWTDLHEIFREGVE